MSGWRYFVGLIGLASGLLFSSKVILTASLPSTPLGNAGKSPTVEALLMNLSDGTYQFCSEPDPQDWRDGAGVCLNFAKQGTIVDGYFGYPHSDRFVCLKGRVSEDWLYGEGLIISWAGRAWSEVPQETFTWDPEGRLHLSQGVVAHSEEAQDSKVDWIVFQQASLNMQGLYRYPDSRMTSPTQLCDWHSAETHDVASGICRTREEGNDY